MRVLVCGGRNFAEQQAVCNALDRVASKHGEIFLIHGGANGADLCAQSAYLRDGEKREKRPPRTATSA